MNHSSGPRLLYNTGGDRQWFPTLPHSKQTTVNGHKNCQEVNSKQEPHVKCLSFWLTSELPLILWVTTYYSILFWRCWFTQCLMTGLSIMGHFSSFHIGKKLSMQHEAGHFTCRSPSICNCYYWMAGKQKEMTWKYGTIAAPKVMPPVLLCWPTTSEVDVGSMALQFEPSPKWSSITSRVIYISLLTLCTLSSNLILMRNHHVSSTEFSFTLVS